MSSNKRSGSDFERRVVRKAKDAGLPAERAYASDGRALGMAKEVDVTIDDWKIQCKHRKRIAQYVKPDKEVDAQIVGDRSGQYAIIRIERFLEILQSLRMDEDLRWAKEVRETEEAIMMETRQ